MISASLSARSAQVVRCLVSSCALAKPTAHAQLNTHTHTPSLTHTLSLTHPLSLSRAELAQLSLTHSLSPARPALTHSLSVSSYFRPARAGRARGATRQRKTPGKPDGKCRVMPAGAERGEEEAYSVQAPMMPLGAASASEKHGKKHGGTQQETQMNGTLVTCTRERMQTRAVPAQAWRRGSGSAR